MMTETQEKLEKLFGRWKERDKHVEQLFIEDGPIDPERWEKADERILFVAKEAYGEEGDKGTWSLPELVREDWKGPKHKFWWSLGYWAIALRETTLDKMAEFPEYTEDYNSTKAAVGESAILNVKKSAGRSSSNNYDLSLYIKQDHDLIREQIDILNPHIIVFCYTWELLQERKEVSENLWSADEITKISQMFYQHKPTGRILVDYWHPANQYPNSVMFHALCALYLNFLRSISGK